MFFFGLLSTGLPYIATFVVMGLYILIGGQPKQENNTLSETSIEISSESFKSSVLTETTIEYCTVLTLEVENFHQSRYQEKNDLPSLAPHYVNHYKGSLGQTSSNKAPPVLA